MDEHHQPYKLKQRGVVTSVRQRECFLVLTSQSDSIMRFPSNSTLVYVWLLQNYTGCFFFEAAFSGSVA